MADKGGMCTRGAWDRDRRISYLCWSRLGLSADIWKAINYMLRWGTGKTGLHIKMGQRRIEFRSLIENVRYKELIPIQMIYPYPQQDGSLWSKS